MAALNHGVEKTKSELLARLEADDFWTEKDKLSKQVEFLEQHQDCGLVGA